MPSSAAQTVSISRISAFDFRVTKTPRRGEGMDEALVFEPAKGFTDGSAAHPELFRELPFIETARAFALIGVETDDCTFQRFVDPILQYCGDLDGAERELGDGHFGCSGHVVLRRPRCARSSLMRGNANRMIAINHDRAGDWTRKENVEGTVPDNQRLAHRRLGERPEHDREHRRRHRIVELAKQVADDAEQEHQPHVVHVLVGAYPPMTHSTKIMGARMVKGILSTQMNTGMKRTLTRSANRLAT